MQLFLSPMKRQVSYSYFVFASTVTNYTYMYMYTHVHTETRGEVNYHSHMITRKGMTMIVKYAYVSLTLYLWVLTGHPAHLFWVQFDRVVAKLSLGGRLQILAAHWKIAVPLHPPHIITMRHINTCLLPDDSYKLPTSQRQ